MMEPRGYVVAIGSVCFDEYYAVDAWVNEGDKCVVRQQELMIGGMVANFACVLAGFGDKTYLVDEMNSGESNRKLLNDLCGCNIDVSHMHFDETLADSKCFIMLSPNERTIFVIDRGLRQRTLSPALRELMRNAAYVYTTIDEFSKFDDPAGLADELRARGAKIAFDVEPPTFQSDLDILFQKADLLFFNKQGFNKYCGGNDSEECLQRLLGYGAQAVVITRGKDGCYGRTEKDECSLAGISVNVVDTTGAGDTFNASFLHCHRKGKGLRDSLQFANAAASRAVQVLGARSGVCSDEDVRAFMKERNLT